MSSSSSDVVESPCTTIYEKITSVFNNVSNDLNGDELIQFWAPVVKISTTGRSRQVLTTLNQPFAHKDEDFQTYRLSCLKYLFSIDDHVNIDQVEEGGYDMMIIRNCASGPATPFEHRLPLLVNLMLTPPNSPLVTSAVQCGLIISVFLPVIDRQRSTSCVGVIELSVKRSGLLPVFKSLITSLEKIGLATLRVQQTRPFKTIHPFNDEIEKALEIVCELYGLIHGQVWKCISYETQKPNLAINLDGYCAESAPSFIKDYHDTCDMLSFVTGDGIAGRTLQTDKPHICLNVDKMTDNALLVALLPASIKSECSCVTICLRSIDKSKDIYVFKFLWPQSRKYYLFLESLLLTLKRCLPSFKFPTVGDDLCIVDVEHPTRNGVGVGFFKILQGNRISQILDALKQGRSWEGETDNRPAFAKRKICDLPHSNKECKRVKQENSDGAMRILVVEFEEKITLFRIYFSSKLDHLQKAINQEFQLASSETYSLKYFYERCWISVIVEEDMEEVIKLMKLENSDYLHFRVDLLPR